MSILSNVKYYLNYLNFARGDTEIKNYFTSNETNKAIKVLIEEGYSQFYIKFEELVESYSLLYPLNKQENTFIKNIRNKFFSKAKSSANYIKYEIEANEVKNFVIFYKNDMRYMNYEYQYSINKQMKALKASLKQICPIIEAAIMRRFCKKLLEELIKDNIAFIDLNYFTPNIQILKNYLSSVSSNYIFREGFNEDIGSRLKYIISDLENKKKAENINTNKNKEISTIIYSNENKTEIKLIKLMLKLKTQCNKIIHLSKEYKDNLDIKNYIYEKLSIEEEIEEVEFEEERNEDSNKNNEIIFPNNKKITKKNVNISISEVAKFIAYEQPTQQVLKILGELSKKVAWKIKFIQDKTNELIPEEKIGDFNYYYKSIIELKNSLEEEISNLPLKDCTISLSKGEIRKLDKYFKEKILNTDDIQINDINNTNDNLIYINSMNYFNNLRKNMTIKEKLKLNVTFEKNICLINIKKKIDELIPIYEKIKNIEHEIEEFKNMCKEELEILKGEIDNINIASQFIKREEIFNSFNQEEFIRTLESCYDKKNINNFSSEINNFKLYIYLLKNNLYDEKSYKSAVGFNDDDW